MLVHFYSTIVSITLCVLLAGSSLLLFLRQKEKISILLLVLAAFILRLYVSQTDLFLHDWDERFHALVAKHVMHDWLHPTLLPSTLFACNYTAWSCSYTWLHKQPLFLWQMALSMKLFGVNEIALRLPSVLLGSLLVWPVYRIGALAFTRYVGYYSALLQAFAFFQLELTSGWMGMDHNDMAFLCYVVGSIWAYYESRSTTLELNKWRWAILAGVFVGCAVLCKWLTGLVVYTGWGVDLLTSSDRRYKISEYWRMIASVATAILVFLPWQLYINWRFPEASAFERDFSTRHFWEVIEGHGGGPWFYFEILPMHYGLLLPLLPIGILLAVTKYRRSAALPLLVVCSVIFLFFSLAKTKIFAFTYIVSPLLFIFMALAVWEFLRFVVKERMNTWAITLQVGVLLLLMWLDIRPIEFMRNHTSYFKPTSAAINSKESRIKVYRQIDALVPAGYVVFNAPSVENIDAMFYSDREIFSGWPTQEQYQELQTKKIPIAVFPPRGDEQLPTYLKQDPNVIILWAKLD